ncbi:RagB/SusD family nutrient uptake outer membrane protein [Rhodothermus profundi]|uniref:SusD family protein n=1 Tax=Rhodothermus profundi TaxID=633813 RepID=A0A1M6W9I2_9BACT|nr:RagB/SusD family nutrient uptake outer membrane protein [Rhodothermus profundi]SHK90289.1 SusD family protein [Rhodothermus profundi]
MIKQRLRWILAVPVLTAFLWGCADLSVQNLNEPDAERVLATPEDVKNILAGGFLTWWQANQGYPGMGPALITMADQTTSSWGNFSMKDLSSEPRVALNNNSTYRYASTHLRPWQRLYSALSIANDVLRRLDEGLIINSPEETQMVRTAAKLLQGLCLSSLSLFYDRAFIVDENTDVATLEFPANSNYKDVAAAAIAALLEAAQLAQNMAVPFPDNYFNGLDLDGEKVAQLAHTMVARTMMLSARTPQENAQTDWNAVLAHAEQGISGWDFAPQGDQDQWWDLIKAYMQRPGWSQADLELLGMDPNLLPALQQWLATPLQDRTPAPFEARLDEVSPADARIPSKGGATAYFVYESGSPFRANRGTYHFSRWRHIREGHLDFLGPMRYATETENDLMIAEALIRTGGDKARAAQLINKTRVNNGGLPALTGSESDQELLEALMYERRIEIGWTAAGIGFCDRRRFDYPGPAHYDNDPSKPGIFQHKPGTLRHFPVPGAELEVLQQPIYTFGGAAGEMKKAPDWNNDRELLTEWVNALREHLNTFGRPVSVQEFLSMVDTQ